MTERDIANSKRPMMPSGPAEHTAESWASRLDPSPPLTEVFDRVIDGLTILVSSFERLRRHALDEALLELIGQAEQGAALIMRASEDLVLLADEQQHTRTNSSSK